MYPSSSSVAAPKNGKQVQVDEAKLPGLLDSRVGDPHFKVVVAQHVIGRDDKPPVRHGVDDPDTVFDGLVGHPGAFGDAGPSPGSAAASRRCSQRTAANGRGSATGRSRSFAELRRIGAPQLSVPPVEDDKLRRLRIEVHLEDVVFRDQLVPLGHERAAEAAPCHPCRAELRNSSAPKSAQSSLQPGRMPASQHLPNLGL